jgi:hypothetical protein
MEKIGSSIIFTCRKKHVAGTTEQKSLTIQECLSIIVTSSKIAGTKLQWKTLILMEIILRILIILHPIRRCVLIDELKNRRTPFPDDINGTIKRIMPMMIKAGIIAEDKRGKVVYYRLIHSIITEAETSISSDEGSKGPLEIGKGRAGPFVVLPIQERLSIVPAGLEEANRGAPRPNENLPGSTSGAQKEMPGRLHINGGV